MDRHYRVGGSDFTWDADKAAMNVRKHGVRFEDAATVFMDPLFVLTDASRNDEARDAVIGFDRLGCLLFVVHIAMESDDCIRITRHGLPSLQRRLCMLNEKLKQRMLRDRPVTSITLRIPVDVVDSLKAIAPHKGYAGYQTLLKAYISEGLRRDETVYTSDAVERFARALKKRGVSGKVLEDAMRDVAA